MSEEFKNKNRIAKEQEVAELTEKIGKASSVVLADYKGLSVKEVTELRSLLRENGVESRVAKNTLINLAIKDMDLEDLKPYLNGPTAIAISYDNPVAPAKMITEFNKKTKKLEIKAGVVEGRFIDENGVKDLASLPSKEELIAKTLGTLNAPITSFVSVLSGTVRNLLYALNAIQEQKAE